MNIDRRAVLAALPLSFFVASYAQANPKHKHRHHSWDGNWSGNWGGQASEATSIRIVNNKVVSYDYRGATTPVSVPSIATPKTFSYEVNGVSISLTRTGAKTATASLRSSMGDGTAELTRQ
jgi:hypothetical protein